MTGSTVSEVHCPSCSHDDTKVIDSRMSEEGSAIRRRRSCPQCAYRFTTYERLEEVPLHVLKRSGGTDTFPQAKMIAGFHAAVTGPPVAAFTIRALTKRIDITFPLKDV